jgi:hypothetical protein
MADARPYNMRKKAVESNTGSWNHAWCTVRQKYGIDGEMLICLSVIVLQFNPLLFMYLVKSYEAIYRNSAVQKTGNYIKTEIIRANL